MRGPSDPSFERFFGVPLHARASFRVCAGRITQQEPYALGGKLLESAPVESLTFTRSRFDLEVSGVYDRADGCIQDEARSIGDRVMDGKAFDRDRADALTAPRGAHAQVHVLQTVLRNSIFDQRRGIGWGVDRDADISQQIGERSNVVLVTMRDDNGPRALTYKPIKVRVHQIRSVLVGERHTTIDRDRRVSADQCRAIHSDFVEPA